MIVSVFYNREWMVEASVRSVVEQLEDDQLVVLVDDGSSDGTQQALKAWEADNVHVITYPNIGFVAAINAAIRLYRSDFIAIHGSGDLSLKGRFRKQQNFLMNNPAYDVVGCSSVFHNLYSGRRYEKNVVFTGDARKRLLKKNIFHHGEVMYTRNMYEKTGGYRGFFRYAQDYDLWCRASCEGFKFHVLPELLYERKVAVPQSVSGTPEKVILQQYYSAFAAYCHEARMSGFQDPLDEYGPVIALRVPPPKRLKKKLWRECIKFIVQGDSVAALRICKELLVLGGIGEIFARFLALNLRRLPDPTTKAVRLAVRVAGVYHDES